MADPRALTSAEAATIRRYQAEGLIGVAKAVYVGSVLTGGVVAFTFWDHSSALTLCVWVALIAVIYHPFFRQWMRRAESIPNGFRRGDWDFMMIVSGFCFAAPWTVPGMLVEPGVSPAHEIFLGYLIIGLTSITIAGNSFNTVYCRSYTATLVLPLVIRNVTSGDPMLIAIGFLTVPYVGYLWSYQLIAYRRMAKAVHHEARNEQLSTELAEANTLLRQKVEELAQKSAEAEAARGEAELARVRAEASSHAKSLFLANMSHELRTPLNAIIGFSEIQERELFGPIGDARYRNYASDIHQSGMHLLSIINDILDMAKIEAGRMELHEAVVSLAGAVTAVVRIVAEQAKLARLKIDVAITTDGDIRLFVDERSLRQMVLNLLSNAIKFTPAGGMIRIEVGHRPSGALAVTVADTGIGIAPEDIERVLRPFGQVDSALNRSHQGTGLGLSLVKSLMGLHQGELELESALGEGTRVSLLFPQHRVRSAGEATRVRGTGPAGLQDQRASA